MSEQRYEVEQLGYSDFGVWDARDEKWVFEGNQADCEERAEALNGGKS